MCMVISRVINLQFSNCGIHWYLRNVFDLMYQYSVFYIESGLLEEMKEKLLVRFG